MFYKQKISIHVRLEVCLRFNDTHMEELDSVQKFIEIQGWLLLTFFICLHNQLKSDSHLPKIFFLFVSMIGLQECFLFHLKNSFRSQDI